MQDIKSNLILAFIYILQVLIAIQYIKKSYFFYKDKCSNEP